ncbi:TonB-dependent receptor [Aureitalea sp. L0-47]|uniref:TonB-dependent receptor n=1 Tax=Aureitalea sp. L0-47 TaxID=2816962 RepID=UPI002237516D|nr:TonB-dependent receptor [Aureitalea sp. L0-47]MCW5518293.1 TonB-dependent receptor [Aureitalea sp. L0-47]
MKRLLLLVFLCSSLVAYSQGTVTGSVQDADLGGPLPNASVVEVGTSNGTISDFDGNFSVSVSSNSGTLQISYLGYVTRTVSFTLSNGTANLGTISMDADAASLGEVVIVGTGVIDLASDRQTPVAVSTITAQEISTKAAGNVEFTEAMKNTPSIYVGNQAGGFGDSQVFLRGFDDTNTAFLLNGQPINSQEDGRMFWSNWAGMSDVANAIQVQRGLGSSKLAISSVGGTVNIISKTTDQNQGGFVRFLAGNDSYFKGTASYNTGLNDSGWAFSFLVDHWQAHRKYAVGTAGQGQNYLFSVGYKPNENHALNFLITGAPQWHDQNFSNDLEEYDLYGEKYNSNTGFLDGERYTERRNFYHKPVANLNWDWTISDNADLSTVAYASWGRGGGTGMYGRGSRIRTLVNGEINFEAIRDNNIAIAENGIGDFDDARIRRSSMNNHNWYGLLSSLNLEAGENWNINVGFDGRMYKGDHFRQVNDLLGLSGLADNNQIYMNEFEADPWKTLFDSAEEGDRLDYDYSENINYLGGFGQAEYATDKFSIFVQGAFSTQSFEREERYNVEEAGKSEKVNKTGYNIKGGASYNINDNHSIFANAGQFSRQPFLDNIFRDIRNSNDLFEPEIDNEEILGLEAGYRFQNDNLRINVDVYRTEWGNRFLAVGGEDDTDPDNPVFFTDRFNDVTQLHQGVEFDFEYRPTASTLRFRGYGSIGNWKYDGETPFTRQNDDTSEFVITDGMLDLTGTKVGNAPQTSFGAGLSVRVCDGLTLDGDYNIYTDLYGFVNPDDVVEAAQVGMRYQAERLPAYTLADAGLTYRFNFGGQRFVFRGNVYNLFNDSYINQRDRFGYFLGIGRTYNASLRLNF